MGTIVDINKYKIDVVNCIVKCLVSAAAYLDDAKILNHLNSKNLLLDATKKEMQQCLNNIHILERMLNDMEFKKEITDAHCKHLMRECGFIDPSEYDLPSNRESNKHKFTGADAIDCMMDRIKDDDCADAFDEFAKTIEIVKASGNEKRLNELEKQFEAVGFKDAKKAAQLAVDKINRDEADIRNAIAVEAEKHGLSNSSFSSVDAKDIIDGRINESEYVNTIVEAEKIIKKDLKKKTQTKTRKSKKAKKES